MSVSEEEVKEKAEDTNCYINMKELEKMALSGNCNAQAQLGRNHLFGRQTSINRQEAEKWLLIAVKRQDTLAGKWAQGICCEEGIGRLKDEKAAFACYQEVAKQGYIPAKLSMARCYEDGRGIGQDGTKALEIYTECALQGNALAQGHVARCYFYCRAGVMIKSVDKAMQFAADSAKKGDSLGQRMLADCYQGDGPIKDMGLAVQFYTLSADQGDAQSQWWLGQYYCNHGNNLKLGIRYYELSAKQGVADSQMWMGRFASYDSWGGQSYAKGGTSAGREWFKLAAAQGHEDAIRELNHLNDPCPGCTIQ